LQAVLHDKVSAVKRMRTLACDLTVATGTLVSGFTEAVATADRQSGQWPATLWWTLKPWPSRPA
jgi:hypothetical protein